MAITEQQILDALRTVRDPGQGADIVSLGMVSGVVVRDGNVGFAIEVEPSAAPVSNRCARRPSRRSRRCRASSR